MIPGRIHHGTATPPVQHSASAALNQLLDMSSTEWIKHIKPAELSNAINKELSESSELANELAVKENGEHTRVIHYKQSRLRLNFNMQHKFVLNSIDFDVGVRVFPNGELQIPNRNNIKALLFGMQQKMSFNQNNPQVDVSKLEKEFTESRVFANEFNKLNIYQQKLINNVNGMKNQFNLAPSQEAHDSIIKGEVQIGELEKQKQLQLANVEKCWDRFDFVSKGKPNVLHVRGGDPSYANAINNFVLELAQSDMESYEKRYQDLDPDDTMQSDAEHMFLVTHNNKIIGIADFHTLPEREIKAAHQNIVLNGRYHGLNAGKALMEAREKFLIENNYDIKQGCVLRDNQEHIARLKKAGWEETPESRNDPTHELGEFWKSMDPDIIDQYPF